MVEIQNKHLYSFQKIYGDLVTDDGTVLILYITWFRMAGIKKRMAAVDLYLPGGEKKFYQGSHQYEPSDFTHPEPGVSLEAELRFPEGSFSIRYEKLHADCDERFSVDGALAYRCLVLRGSSAARLETETGIREFAGEGYLDDVELGKLTRFIGLKRLDWGRVHLPDRSILFNSVQLKEGAPFTLFYLKKEDQPARTADQFSLSLDRYRNRQDLKSEIMPGETIRLHPVQSLHRGPAIDKRHFPGNIERGLFSLITGPAYENRWLSRCSVNESSLQNGWALHERVYFGKNHGGRESGKTSSGRVFYEDQIKS